jgi:hypothetical protein
MLGQLVGACYLIQGENLGNIKPPPSRREHPIDSASRIQLCLSRNVITADEEESGVHEDKLPDRNPRRRSIGGVGRIGSALCQYLRIRSDLCPKMGYAGGQERPRYAFLFLRLCIGLVLLW